MELPWHVVVGLRGLAVVRSRLPRACWWWWMVVAGLCRIFGGADGIRLRIFLRSAVVPLAFGPLGCCCYPCEDSGAVAAFGAGLSEHTTYELPEVDGECDDRVLCAPSPEDWSCVAWQQGDLPLYPPVVWDPPAELRGLSCRCFCPTRTCRWVREPP